MEFPQALTVRAPDLLLVVWTLSASVGAYVSWVEWRHSRAVVRAISDPNGLRTLAEGHVRRDLVRFFIQGMWTIIGVPFTLRSMLIPTSGVGSFTVYILIMTNLLTLLNTVLDARDRRYLESVDDRLLRTRVE